MSNIEKAIKVVQRLESRATDLERDLLAAECAARSAEANAAELAGEPGFDSAVENISRTTARVSALRIAQTKLRDEREAAILAVGRARQAELIAEAESLEAEVHRVHAEARRHLDKLASVMGVEVYPITILFGRVVAPADLRTLDVDSLPVDFVQFVPNTVALKERANARRREAAELDNAADARRAAQQLMEREVAA